MPRKARLETHLNPEGWNEMNERPYGGFLAGALWGRFRAQFRLSGRGEGSVCVAENLRNTSPASIHGPHWTHLLRKNFR